MLPGGGRARSRSVPRWSLFGAGELWTAASVIASGSSGVGSSAVALAALFKASGKLSLKVEGRLVSSVVGCNNAY